MSQENVEVVRAAYRAWNGGDMDSFRELYDPDVILRPPGIWPEPGPFVGWEAVMRLFEQAREVWDADTLEPMGDFIDAADRVVVRYAWRGAGRPPKPRHRRGADILPLPSRLPQMRSGQRLTPLRKHH
jgi:ketosteroid isomerase-like protein